MRILVVDDEIAKPLADTVKYFFPTADVVSADGGQRAIQELQVGCDFLVTDYNMPKVGGLEVIQAALQAGLSTERIIVITGSGISAQGTLQNLKAAEALGIKHCLKKPFGLKDMGVLFKEMGLLK